MYGSFLNHIPSTPYLMIPNQDQNKEYGTRNNQNISYYKNAKPLNTALPFK